MAIPGSVMNGLGIDPSQLGDNFYPSRATFLSITKTRAASGQELHTFLPTGVPAYTEVPCRKSPIILVRPQNQERDASEVDVEVERFQVNLAVFLPNILDTWQVSVEDRDQNGVAIATTVFEIQAVEPDGTGASTRLIVANIKPFNS